MKTIFKHTVLFVAALLVASVSSFAQEEGKPVLSKTVKDKLDGTYTLTLESYVKGYTQELGIPTDVVVLLDRSTSMWSNKMDDNSTTRAYALNLAVKKFLDEMYKCAAYDIHGNYISNESDRVDHRVAIIDFYGGSSTSSDNTKYETTSIGLKDDISEGWKSVRSQTTVNNLKTKIDTYFPNTNSSSSKKPSQNGTPAVKGLSDAGSLLASSETGTRNKMVVFFTDGSCGYGQSAWTAVDSDNGSTRKVAKAVVDMANTLKKNYNAIIYSIGVFGDQGDNQKEYNYYLNHVSSKYNTSISGTDNNWSAFKDEENEAPDNNYVFQSGSTEELNAAFETIAYKVKQSDNAGNYDATTVILDVMEKNFSLPNGTDKSSIKLYTCNVDDTNTKLGSYSDVKWASTGSASGGKTVYKAADNSIVDSASASGYDHTEYWAPIANASNMIFIGTDSQGEDQVEVTGFDFSKHFVGFDKNVAGTNIGWNKNGQKIIIQFDIKVEKAHTGGVNVNTNKEISGFYNAQKDDKGTVVTDPNNNNSPKVVISEDDPTYDQPIVHLPYIKISMNGLKQGESAVFRVTKVDKDGNVDEDVPFSATVVVTQALDPATAAEDPYAIVKLLTQGYYKVEELEWTWAYDPDDPTAGVQIKQLLTVKDEDWTDADKFVVFPFVDKQNTSGDTNEHAESFVPNNMDVNRALGDSKTGESK